MLLESKRVKRWLKQSISKNISSHRDSTTEDDISGVSFNPMPALIIFLLGIMMGGHHQQQMVSAMVHKQWGKRRKAGNLKVMSVLPLYPSSIQSLYPFHPTMFCLCTHSEPHQKQVFTFWIALKFDSDSSPYRSATL